MLVIEFLGCVEASFAAIVWDERGYYSNSFKRYANDVILRENTKDVQKEKEHVIN